ncbi:MAG: choice-of-anchor L domain-containing protein [Salibacteraceae bacterium]
MNLKFTILFPLLVVLHSFSFAQVKIDIYPTEEFMITHMLVGDSSTNIWNVQFQGPHESRAIFYSQNTVMPIKEGIVLSTGNAKAVTGPNKGTGFTGSNLSKGDQDLHYLAKYKTYDATWISFEFEAQHNLVRFNYVFASEEYPEYVGSTFNDVFGFFLTNLETGDVTNLAVIPNTLSPITVNNINHKTHSNFYLPNAKVKSEQIEFDGLTQPLIAYSEVVPGNKYRIKIAIADVGDDAFDSGVFLEGKSFKSESKKEFFKNNKDYFEAFSNSKNVRSSKQMEAPNNELNPNTSSQPKKSASKNQHLPKTTSKFKKTTYTNLDSIIIYFDFDKYEATQSELNKAKTKIANSNISQYSITITGHTDQKGTDAYNTTLSKKRANFVSKWMETNYHITPSHVNHFSFHQLAQSQTTPTARSKNRRVVILFKEK